MSTPFRIKRSAVPGKRPVVADLQLGELALNTYDGYLFSQRDTGGVGIGTTVSLLTPWIENYGGQSIYYNQSVGIGTTNATSKLTVVGDVYISGISTLGIITATNLTAQSLVISGISTLGITSATNLTSQQLNVSGISTFTNGPILVGTATSTGTASQRLQVTGGAYVSGSVGIGTTNPFRQLHIAQNSTAEIIIEQSNSRPDFRKWNFVADSGNPTTTGNFYLRLLNDAGNATTKTFWNINGSNNTQSFYDTVLIGTATSTGTASQPLQVSGGAYVSGNLGIGTTTPTSTLTVIGSSLITGISTVGLGTTSTPPSNSQMSFELTTNTNLVIKVRGTDGLLRSANITLA